MGGFSAGKYAGSDARSKRGNWEQIAAKWLLMATAVSVGLVSAPGICTCLELRVHNFLIYLCHWAGWHVLRSLTDWL